MWFWNSGHVALLFGENKTRDRYHHEIRAIILLGTFQHSSVLISYAVILTGVIA